eukprot:CAMPEP_0180371818 /NCGR_PEP_ID=MMETSP0989-20121125/20086_1 /TAXON_ID=697907 /ORGANISM="non described non described, Strain CCMP2293" /LENGTH=162 /DNA_ID=CAMNT_0022367995 /DNA_START=74 /DNA_END=562 /DNA_ORIENTATION=+
MHFAHLRLQVPNLLKEASIEGGRGGAAPRGRLHGPHLLDLLGQEGVLHFQGAEALHEKDVVGRPPHQLHLEGAHVLRLDPPEGDRRIRALPPEDPHACAGPVQPLIAIDSDDFIPDLDVARLVRRAPREERLNHHRPRVDAQPDPERRRLVGVLHGQGTVGR